MLVRRAGLSEVFRGRSASKKLLRPTLSRMDVFNNALSLALLVGV